MFTEQIIKSIDEIESIKIEKNRISVITKNLFRVLAEKDHPFRVRREHIIY